MGTADSPQAKADPAAAPSPKAPATGGQDRPIGYAHATLAQLVTFGWIAPLLQLGAKGLLREDTAEAFMDTANTAQYLERQFQAAYSLAKVRSAPYMPSAQHISFLAWACIALPAAFPWNTHTWRVQWIPK